MRSELDRRISKRSKKQKLRPSLKQSLPHTKKNLRQVFGNKDAKEKTLAFLNECRSGSVLLLHGPSGTGKTILAQTAARVAGVFLHTLRNIEKDDENIMKRLGDFMLPKPTYDKECFLIDPFEEVSQDAATTKKMCALLQSDRARRSGRCFIIVVNDPFHKAYYHLRTGKMASIVRIARMFPLRDGDIRSILSSEGINSGRHVKLGIRHARGDGRQAVAFARNMAVVNQKDLVLDRFRATTAILTGESDFCAKATSCPEKEMVKTMVRTNVPKFVANTGFMDDRSSVDVLMRMSQYYDSACLVDIYRDFTEVSFAFAAEATAGGNHGQRLDLPIESFSKKMQMKEVSRMNEALMRPVHANLFVKIISKTASFWCAECNKGVSQGLILHCPHAELSFQMFRKNMSYRLSDSGVNPKTLIEAHTRFDGIMQID